MRQRFLPLKLALAVILAASLSADPARAVDDVAEYTGSKQPVTTRLGVPKSQRDPSPWWSFGKGEEKKEEDRSIDDGMAKSSIAYPTGKISTSSLLLEKAIPAPCVSVPNTATKSW